jgi:hypothetical protein
METIHMIRSVEQRASLRSGVHLPVTLSHFHIGCNYGPLEAEACNQSVSGLCIISRYELPEKMLVFIHASKFNPGAISSEPLFKSSTVGEVRWCRRIEDQEGERYLAGIRYF